MPYTNMNNNEKHGVKIIIPNKQAFSQVSR